MQNVQELRLDCQRSGLVDPFEGRLDGGRLLLQDLSRLDGKGCNVLTRRHGYACRNDGMRVGAGQGNIHASLMSRTVEMHVPGQRLAAFDL